MLILNRGRSFLLHDSGGDRQAHRRTAGLFHDCTARIQVRPVSELGGWTRDQVMHCCAQPERHTAPMLWRLFLSTGDALAVGLHRGIVLGWEDWP